MHQVTENPSIDVNRVVSRGKTLKIALLHLVAICCTALLVACEQHSAVQLHKQESRDRTLRRGLPGEPQTLDPQLADDTFSFQVIRDLYEGLTAEDRAGGIVPGVAESWTVDQHGKIYTFKLRPNAKWSDDTPVTAGEFVAGLRKAVDPKTASGSAALLVSVKGASEIIAGKQSPSDLAVVALDNYTLRIDLVRPAPFILQVLSQPIAAPLHVLEPSTSHQESADAVVSNGPYVLLSRVLGSYMELGRNTKYWDAAHVAIDKVRYVNSESESTELREYYADQLDLTFTIPMPDLKRVTETRAQEIQTAPILATLYLAFNLDEPFLRNDVELRQALSMAIDRDLISDRVMLGVSAAYSFVADGTTGYSPPKYEWANWTHDKRIAYARELFKHAGYDQSKPLHIRLYYNRDEAIQRIMLAVAESWKANLGVVCDLSADEFRVFLAGRKDRKRWDIARLGWNADYDDPASFLDIFGPASVENDARYVSPSYDEAIKRANTESDPDFRMLLLRQSEEILLKDYPIIPIYFYRARRLVKPDVGGASITPLNHTYTKHLFWK